MAISPSTRTCQEVFDHVTRQFGDEAGVQVIAADVIRWINQAAYDILSKNPVIKKTATTTVNADQAEYDLPVDSLRVEWINFDNYALEHKSFADVRERVLGTYPNAPGARRPEFWYDYADKFVLYPPPSETIVDGMTVMYSAVPARVTALTDPVPVPDRLYNRLLEYIMVQAHEMDEDWPAAAAKGAQFEHAMSTIAEEENHQGIGYYPTITVLAEDM